jgi:hypothetical protein
MNNTFFWSIVNFFIITVIHQLNAQGIPSNIKECLEKSEITEDNMLNGPFDCRKVLMDYMLRNWRDVILNLESIAPDDRKKSVIMRACESLPADEYMDFLEKCRDDFYLGKLNSNVFENALRTSRYKHGFYAINYQNPRMRSFIESVKNYSPDKSKDDWRNGWSDILSGKAKVNFEEWQQIEDRELQTNLMMASEIKSPMAGERVGKSNSSRPDQSLMSNFSVLPPLVGHTPTETIESKSRLWPRLLGMLTMTVFVLIALKRRYSKSERK